MTEEKTLEEILDGKSIFLRIEGNNYSSQMWRSIEDVIQAVRIWLQQKQNKEHTKHVKTTSWTEINIRSNLFEELLEELK